MPGTGGNVSQVSHGIGAGGASAMLSRGVGRSPATFAGVAFATPLPCLARGVLLGVWFTSLGRNLFPVGSALSIRAGLGGVARAIGSPNSGGRGATGGLAVSIAIGATGVGAKRLASPDVGEVFNKSVGLGEMDRSSTKGWRSIAAVARVSQGRPFAPMHLKLIFVDKKVQDRVEIQVLVRFGFLGLKIP